jgi:hypothetical protein
MKTFKSSVRLWFAALFISAGVLCAIWTLPISTAREKLTFHDGYMQCHSFCMANNKTEKSQDACDNACWAYWWKNGSDQLAPAPQRHPIGPPRKFGPSPSPTGQRYPFGPPRKFGPSPSPTAMPILLAKPAKPTPTPEPTPKKNSHSHHSG